MVKETFIGSAILSCMILVAVILGYLMFMYPLFEIIVGGVSILLIIGFISYTIGSVYTK